MNQQEKEKKQPDWLTHVQQQSWEPKLLISGLILSVVLIMSIFPGFQYIDEFANYMLFSIGLLFIFDLVTLGLMRRIPYLQKLYYPLYRAGLPQ